MEFIKIEELRTRKFQSLINDLSTDDNNILVQLEEMVIDEIKAYLKTRYDIDHIFSRKDNERSPLIKRLVLDGILCLLYDVVNSSEKPESLKDRCEKNEELLMNIASGKIAPDLPPLDSELQSPTIFKGGSESKFNDTSFIN